MSKHFMLLRKVGREQDLFQAPDRPPALLETMPSEQTVAPETTRQEVRYRELPRQEVSHQQVQRQRTEPRNQGSQIRWPEVIKERNRGVAQDGAKRASDRSDLETLRYREQVKLVQRIFPINVQSTPQLVLFSSLESKTDACSITARSAEILAARAEGPGCVVDANLRSPLVHRYFGVENRRGLSDSICGPGPVQDFAVHVSNSDLWVM